MYKYKLVQRSNPLVKGSPKKWYASPLSEAAHLELLGNYARQQLLQGHTVRVGDLGTLRITFKSDGVEDITKYNASTMIKEPRILFMPSREFREAVIGAIQFENGGVLDGDVNYASLDAYRKAKNITTPGGGGTEPGGDDGDGGGQSGNPL